jgi:molybdopterin adenylyltransferase
LDVVGAKVHLAMTFEVGVLTISDRASKGDYQDQSGPLIADIVVRKLGWPVAKQSIVSDEIDEISEVLKAWSDAGLNLILTSGGTGFAQRDVTPEATLNVITKETPGISQALRLESLKITRHAMLSRAVSGIRKQTLIINLPGSPRAVKENLEVLVPVLPHAIALITGETEAEGGHRTV